LRESGYEFGEALMVTLVDAQAAINALRQLDTNAFVGQIAGHAFTDHMSKHAASAAAVNQHVTKGYFETVTTTTINSVDQFKTLSDKNKAKVYAGYAGKKPSQLGRFVIHKSLTKTTSMTANDMARLVMRCIADVNAQYRAAGIAGRFLVFADVQTVLYPAFVARSIDEHGTKTGGGGVATFGLQWAVLVVTANAGNSVVVSAYPSDDAYRNGRVALV